MEDTGVIGLFDRDEVRSPLRSIGCLTTATLIQPTNQSINGSIDGNLVDQTSTWQVVAIGPGGVHYKPRCYHDTGRPNNDTCCSAEEGACTCTRLSTECPNAQMPKWPNARCQCVCVCVRAILFCSNHQRIEQHHRDHVPRFYGSRARLPRATCRSRSTR